MSTLKLVQILDDNAPDFKYSGGQWTLSTLVQWYQQTSNYPAFVTATQFGSFSLTFQGTSIAFIGNTPPEPSSQTALVSIDGGAPSEITYPGTPPAYIQWYQSPTLSEGIHSITVSRIDGTAVDYALIEVGQDTPLSGKTIVVDDDDPAIQYAGSWIRDTDEFDAGSLPDGFPLRNGTHRTSKVGDTVTFRFFGTSYAVYGIFSWENLGLLSATYTLDGSSTAQSYPVTKSSPQFVKGDKEAVNLQYFSQDGLPPGEHLLIINVTQSQDVLYILDYITYTPSFSTLSTMPSLGNNTIISSGGSGISTLSALLSTSSTTSATGLPQRPAKGKTSHVGPIAGGIVGAVVVLAALAVTLLLIRRRQKKPARFGMHSDYSASVSAGQPVAPVHQAGDRQQLNGAISPFRHDTNPSPIGSAESPVGFKKKRFNSSAPISNTPPLPTSVVTSQTGTNIALSAIGSTEIDSTTPPSNRDSNPPAYDSVSTLRRSNLPP
ncbi:hypothetical protein JR316_0009067 [Psilocybe cubensis]|uniref:Transmembrane protein n=2 Tax=Psilocybe cubensis TaxID=181762 RepID=A0A8H7XV43_PSICU|nr:hypothetical protein JR316_0009067 [Psilocybe cubensis]KAH9478610.1 hypothetical protein JR316_0009067 [Psilocybe cubensis]